MIMESDTCFCEGVGTFDPGGAHEVQDEEDEQDEEDVTDDNYILDTPTKFITCPISHPCVLCSYLIIVLLILASSVTIVVVGVLVVAPFHRTNHFEPAICSPESVIRDIDRRCSCGKGCNSQYPRITINVRIYASGKSRVDNLKNDVWIANISDDEVILPRPVSKSLVNICFCLISN